MYRLFLFLGLLGLFPGIGFAQDRGAVDTTLASDTKSSPPENLNDEQSLSKRARFELELSSLKLKDIAGTRFSTNQTEGKPVVLFFWSIYCRGCSTVASELSQLQREVGEEKFAIVPVHLFETDISRLVKHLPQLRFSFPVLLSSLPVRDWFSVNVVPTSLVFDAERKLTARIEGKLEGEDIKLQLFGAVETPEGE